jgi:2-polyprenyl-3-methyl-5-hydroxy-6-metoxy-1,4-benzoquinol methylase
MTPEHPETLSHYYGLPRAEILPHILRPPVNALEVGCGEGFFGESLINSFACTVVGLEPNSAAAACAHLRLSKVLNLSIEEALPEFPEVCFDAIFLNDVLEHLYDPTAVLSQLKSKLTEDGLIYASIPNLLHYQVIIDLLSRRDFIYQSAGILDFTHVRWFTKRGMARLFHDAGLSVISQIGINPTISRLQRLISLASLGFYEETKYPQFITIGRK